MLFKSKSESEAPAKRGRGRPRKYPLETSAASNVEKRSWAPKRLNKRTIVWAVVILLIAALPSFYFYHKAQNNQAGTNAELISAAQKRIGKHVILPADETPSLIPPLSQDQINKLATQAFFQKAKPGDEVLVYSRAGRAILYRPSVDRVVEMAPLNIGTTKNPASQ